MSNETSLTKQEEQGMSIAGSNNFHAIEQFTKLLNRKPPLSSLQDTPDKKAKTMGISFVETKLDEVYLRQWGTENVNVLLVGNEVCVWLDLWVIDPQTRQKITRSGFSAVQITVDAVPERLKWKDGETEEIKKERNAWSLDMSNKKPNALYLSFPKARSMAIKNAAATLGKAFGRDLNRKYVDSPGEFYENVAAGEASLNDAIKELEAVKTIDQMLPIWNRFPELHENEIFKMKYFYYNRKHSAK